MKKMNHDCKCNDGGMDYLNALVDLQPVLVRVGVLAAHAHDLVQAHSPESTRALNLLFELELLAKDGSKRIADTGIAF